MTSAVFIARIKPLVFAALSLPMLWLLWQWGLLIAGRGNALGVDPVEATNRFLGDTALRILLLALAISPLRDMTGIAALTRLRRMLGLFAFFYVCVHLGNYIALELGFSLARLWKDLVKRTYITLGMSAFALLLPLALTSTHAALRRLGPRRWQQLHRLVYPAAILAAAHYIFMAKGFQLKPLVYAAVLALLLGWRLVRWQRGKSRQQKARLA